MNKFLAYILITMSMGLTSVHVFSQQNIGNLLVRNKYKGDQYFLDFYYKKAITYYELALKKDINKDALRLKIGDSYRLLQDYEKAETWYREVMEVNPDVPNPIYKYHYASALMAAGKYDEARGWLKAYKIEVPEDSRSQRKIDGINNLPLYFIDSSIVEITPLPMNTSFSEVAPVAYKDGMVFLSARTQNSLVDHDNLRKEDLYDLYYVSYDAASGWGETVLFDKVLNTPFHEGPVSFYTGEDKLLLTRSNYLNKRQTVSADGNTKLQLFTAVKTGEIWANIQPFELNNPSYSIAHPALNSTNDTLFFVSDKPGGFGGTDLYMSVYADGWSGPVNLGPAVNTEGNELFPSYVSSRLFFASDGHDGLGGLDIYKAVLEGGIASYVTNLGSPVNSTMDDFSYTIDPITKTGYFASNRPGGMGSDDIFSFSQKAQVLQGIAIQEQDRSPLAGVQINLIEDGLAIATCVTGADGTFRFYLPLSSDFKITAHKYEHSLKTDLQLTTRGNQVDIDSLLIEMHKHDFFARGLVYDSETQKTMHDVSIIISDENSHQVDTVFTGINGMYSFIIEPGKNYVIRAEKDRFSSDSLQINTFSISKGVITNDFILDEEYIDKENIYFDYGKYDLRPDDLPVLHKVVDILKRYPNDWLIIGAHADSRGSREYNQELSEKRAEAVVEFFITNGVPRDKIIARGFGEGLVLNRCVDGINCHEEDHSKNRRAEIKVEEHLPEDELENIK